jgi:SulP family sulfate permease
LSLVVVSIISILVYISLTEADAGEEIDLEKDLKAAGIANMLSAVFSGAICFHTPVDTRLARQISGNQRLIGFTFAALSLLMIAVGSSLIGFFPKPIMGGVIMLIGIQVLYENLTRSRRQLEKSEFFLVLLIAAAVIKLGALQGIGVGIVVVAILFIIDYSRVDPVASQFSGRFHQSKVERSKPERQYLKDHGTQSRVFVLQGYLFFGSAERVFKHIQGALNMPTVDNRRHVRFVLLDFHLVNGIDASAINVFRKLSRITEHAEIDLIFTDLNHEFERQFQINGLFQSSRIMKFDQFDYAMEWCENRLLKDRERLQGLPERQRIMGEKNLLGEKIKSTLKMYGHLIQLKKNEILFKKGAPSDCLYMIERGNISIMLNDPDHTLSRLRKMGQGTILGEIGLYTHMGRSAQAFAEDDSSLWVLPGQRLRDLENDHPRAANELHRFILKSLSLRMSRDSEAMQEKWMRYRQGAFVS